MLAPQTAAMEMDAAVGIGHHYNTRLRRKRKADAQPENNERLSKRLSLLNLEHNGPKLYVPVENPLAASATSPAPATAWNTGTPASSSSSSAPIQPGASQTIDNDDEMMQLDDSKYKVYIYNLDDELSSESEAEDNGNGTSNGRLLFLPDIEKHLKKNRIPQHILTDPRAPELAVGMELVLYSIPSSISVPEEQDSVRKAIIEARARAREKREAEKNAALLSAAPAEDVAAGGLAGAGTGPGAGFASVPPVLNGLAAGPAIPEIPAALAGGMQPLLPVQPVPMPVSGGLGVGDDDAMDID